MSDDEKMTLEEAIDMVADMIHEASDNLAKAEDEGAQALEVKNFLEVMTFRIEAHGHLSERDALIVVWEAMTGAKWVG